jgi:hypothetical protein
VGKRKAASDACDSLGSVASIAAKASAVIEIVTRGQKTCTTYVLIVLRSLL